MDSIRALAEGIGPRVCGSAGERAAAEWLAEQLRAAGYGADLDPFPAYPTFMTVYAPLAIIGALSLFVAWWWPLLGAMTAAMAGCLLLLENFPVQVLSRLVKFRQSRNVVAQRAPAGQSQQDIVVVGHLDSPLVSDIKSITLVRALFLGMIASSLAVAAVALVAGLGVAHWILVAGVPFGLLLAVCAAIMIHQSIASPPVPGAGDNGSGVAAMLQAARELSPLQCSTVWFVGTGGEEAGLLGALRFVERQRFARERTWFINLDMVSAGALRTSREEGMLFRHRADPHLCRIADEEGQAEGFGVPSEVLRAMSTDACVPLSRGYRATTISSNLGYWHQLTDTVANVDPAVPARAAVLVCRMIERLDSDQA